MLSKSVSSIKAGICQDGETVNIGYFREQPVVMVSPYDLQVYNAAYPSQSQTANIKAVNLRKVSNNWYFDTMAKLNVSTGVTSSTGISASGAFPLPTVSGGTLNIKTTSAKTLTLTTASITLVANTRSITVDTTITRRLYYTVCYTSDENSMCSHAGSVKMACSIIAEYQVGGSWLQSTATSLTAVTCKNSVTNNISIMCTSASADITAVRIVATFTTASGVPITELTAVCDSTGSYPVIPTQNTVSVSAPSVRGQLVSSTVSINGKASI